MLKRDLGDQGHRHALRRPRRRCSTASTRCSSPSSPATTSRSRSSTDRRASRARPDELAGRPRMCRRRLARRLDRRPEPGPAADHRPQQASGVDLAVDRGCAWRSAPVPAGSRESLACRRSIRAGDRRARARPRRRAPRRPRGRGRCRSRSRASTAARVADRLPEPRQGVEAPGDGVLAAGGVLDQQRHVGLEQLQRLQPAPEPRPDPVLGVAGVDDRPPRPRSAAAASQVCWRIFREPWRTLFCGEQTLIR